MSFNIPEEYYPIVSDYAKILIPSFITFLITLYGYIRPKKFAIKEKQFELVYLPLYLLVKQYLRSPEEIQNNFQIFIRKVDKLIYKNYQFVYPKTLRLFENLKTSSPKELPKLFQISNFEYQVISDYEKLKRQLGYPTNTFLDFFKRLNKIDKIIYFIDLMLFVVTTCITASFFIYVFNHKIIEAISAFVTFGVCVVLIYLARILHQR